MITVSLLGDDLLPWGFFMITNCLSWANIRNLLSCPFTSRCVLLLDSLMEVLYKGGRDQNPQTSFSCNTVMPFGTTGLRPS
jgi:hypothetical protein